MSVGFSIDPAEGTEPISAMSLCVFPGKVLVEERSRAIQMAKQELANLTLWCDRSKLDQGGIGAAVVWREKGQDKGWRKQKVTLGKNKEILDAEIWGISEAVKVAERKCSRAKQSLIINIFCDSQTAINKLRVLDSKAGQALKAQIYQKVEQLVRNFNMLGP